MTKTETALALRREGLSYKEIARRIGSTKASVGALLTRARKCKTSPVPPARSPSGPSPSKARKERSAEVGAAALSEVAATERERVIALGLPIILRNMTETEIARVLFLAFGADRAKDICASLNHFSQKTDASR